MFKKIGIVTALSTALLFGGAFSSDAEASTKQNQQVNLSYKVLYSVNGEWGTVSGNDMKGLLDKVSNRFDINWNNIDWKSLQVTENNENTEENVKQPVEEAPVKEEAPVEQPVEEAPVKEEAPVEQPVEEAPVKEEAPVEQPVEEAPVKEEAPVEQPVEEAPVKEEAPAEQPATPVQQPVQQEAPAEQKQEQSQQLNQFEQEVVELTNQERAKQGLSALQIDTELSKVAREKSNDMAVNNYFDHNSPTYGSPFDMMNSFGITYNTAGENIAQGQRTPAEVVEAWMNSEGHRANILNGNYTHIGVGYVEQGNHWTQQFIGK
ncbi:CAP domain-containing protein [Oceanobacillus sp. CF4.6]|uniref:CAP domain-containing protein n=1 Tax=Oceanobacillus sp. CF4.6 TaxID=3373080 RepID=UPI003EE66943